MTDGECEELMFLFGVVRNGNGTPQEVERLKELMRKWNESQKERD